MTFGDHHLRGCELVSFKLISDLRGLYLTDGSSAAQSKVEPWARCHDDAPMPSLTSSISLESVALSRFTQDNVTHVVTLALGRDEEKG